MNKCYIILTLAAVALALPNYEPASYSSAVISEGPWVTDEAWAKQQEDNRDAKGILDAPQGLLARLGSWWDWDRETVKEGIFKNENIMIHVGQNLFNFVFTTLAWFTVSQIYSLTAAVNPVADGRNMRSITISEAADEVLEAIREFEHKHK